MMKKIVYFSAGLLAIAAAGGILASCGSQQAAESESTSEMQEITVASEQQETVAASEGRIGGNQGHGNGNGQAGGAMTSNSAEIQAVLDENAGKFQQFTYLDEESGVQLEYSLFIPADYDSSQLYPLVMFIPDSTGAGKSAQEIVEQYYGATVWATDADQEKHPSFVVVPAFSEVVVDDDFHVSEQIEVAVRLLEHLMEEYSIDRNRLYTTGQSMGCMTSLYLNSVYPDLFAASLYISGQWDIQVLQNMENQKFFYIVAGGDEKASAGQDEVKAMFDADQIPYSYGEWNAQDSEETQNSAASALIAEGVSANMIRFEAGSVLNGGSGMEHMTSFNYGYSIVSVRDWLFAQSKN